jgi:prevent-host-death family protein
MDEIAIVDARARFSDIARRVKETGRAVRVTNPGEELVDITPIAPHPVKSRSAAIPSFEAEMSLPQLPGLTG